MLKMYVAFFFVTLSVKSFCQTTSALPDRIRASETLDNISKLSTGEVLYGIPQPEGKVIGDTYLNNNWLQSTVLLYEKEKLLEGYPVRYDIQLDELEIKGKSGVKVLRGDKVKSFVMIDSLTINPKYYVNGKSYRNEENVQMAGFFQVLSDGSKPLFKKTSIAVKKGNYNVQFDVGSRDDKLLRKYNYYMVEGDKVIEVPLNNKKLLPAFGDKAADVEKFIKINSLSPKKENHLKAIFEHYNQLVQKSESQ